MNTKNRPTSVDANGVPFDVNVVPLTLDSVFVLKGVAILRAMAFYA